MMMGTPWPPAGLPTPYYVDDWTVIYHADCHEVLPLLALKSVDLVLTDPPYFRVKQEWWDRQWKTATDYLAWIGALCQQWQRVLTPNGSVYCFASPEMATQVELLIREHFVFLNRILWQKEDGWHQKAEKEELRGYLSPWEAILFAEQADTESQANDAAGYGAATHALHKRVYAPIARYLQQERERAGVTRDQVDVGLGYVRTKNPERGTELCRRWEEGSSLPTKETYELYRQFLNNGHTSEFLRQEYEDLRQKYEFLRQEYEELRQEYEELRRPFALTPTDQWSDVWRFPTVKPGPGKHPCEKPLRLLSQIIHVSSRPGDVLLDCCAGRGSLLDAAKQLGRYAIGIEIDERWCQATAERLRQEVFPFPGGV